MTDDTDAILDVLGDAGSMSPETIADELVTQHGYEERDAKLAVTKAITDGTLEEHPSFENHYRPP